MKKRLFTSIVALFLCFIMLIGTTFAWFTDVVSSNGNIIQTGNLKVEMYWSDELLPENSDEWQNAENGAIFKHNNWEPGYTEVKYIKVKNAGSLNLKWKMSLEAEGKVTDLSDVIDVYYVNPVVNEITKADMSSLTSKGKLTDVLSENLGEDGRLEVGESCIVAIAFYMDEEAGNEYQNKSLCEAGFAVRLMATQATGEYDSFNDQYDANAEWPYAAIKYAVSESIEEIIDTTTGTLTQPVAIGETEDTVSATIPAAVKLADGAQSVTLKVESVESSKADVAPATPEEVVRAVDVHIDGISEDNTVPMTVVLKKFLPAGLNNSNVKLYHVEKNGTASMTLVTSVAALSGHNEFYYDALTGDVVISIASFSEIASVSDEGGHWDGVSATAFAGGTGTSADPFLIANASQLAYFRDLVDSGETFEGEYVKLAANVYLNHEGEFANLFDPIGWGYSYAKHNRGEAPGKVFKGTFDGDNYAIHGLWQNGWDLEAKTGTDYTYTNCGGGLFAAVENATIKNLVMIDAIVTYECVEAGIVVGLAQGNCTFDNVRIFDSKIANYQRPAGGIVGEISPSRNADGTAIPCTFTFNQILLDTSVVVGSLWGDFDTPVGGVIGARWDDDNASKVVMTNSGIACALDVYNDVTSTYQWYAYRRAGMLIGNTDTPPADGKNSKVATADFLTCEEVYVYYTNWAKYNYCQFTNHNSNWPWVRVQAGENCEAYSNPRYGVPNDINGNRVTGYDHVHKDGDQCNVQIYFNQLYGGGQGVYGQPEHAGVYTDVQYLITFMHDDHVAGIQFIRSTAEHTVVFPDFATLPHFVDHNPDYTTNPERYNWINAQGQGMDTNNTKIAEGNRRDIFYYINYTQKFYAHFVDKDGFYVAQLEFDPKKGTFLNGATEPAVPEVPGYNAMWSPYTLKDAKADVIIKAVYSKRDDAENLGITNINDLFDLLSKGHALAMSQDLSGSFGNASKNIFCKVVNVPDEGKGYESRLDLNSFTLEYQGDSSANKNWTLFQILGAEGTTRPASKLIIGDGFAGFGTLRFNLTKLNGNAKPTIFDIKYGATLVIERGVVIEFNYPANNGNEITVFKGISDISEYSGLVIETDTPGVIRITANARTVLVGDVTTNTNNT